MNSKGYKTYLFVAVFLFMLATVSYMWFQSLHITLRDARLLIGAVQYAAQTGVDMSNADIVTINTIAVHKYLAAIILWFSVVFGVIYTIVVLFCVFSCRRFCPYCKKKIHTEAKLCPYCRSNLDEAIAKDSQAVN